MRRKTEVSIGYHLITVVVERSVSSYQMVEI
jgi:hypothetical protein